MPISCILCGVRTSEGAHVEARRMLPFRENRIQNIIRLCALCHEMFDSAYVTIHPAHRIFVFSLRADRQNVFQRFRYAYPYDGSLDTIKDSSILSNSTNEFAYELGDRELTIRFPIKPPPKWLRLSYEEHNANPRLSVPLSRPHVEVTGSPAEAL